MAVYRGGGRAAAFLLVHGLAYVQAVDPEWLGQPGLGQHGHVNAVLQHRLRDLPLLLRAVEASDVPGQDGQALVPAGLVALLVLPLALRLGGRPLFRGLRGL